MTPNRLVRVQILIPMPNFNEKQSKQAVFLFAENYTKLIDNHWGIEYNIDINKEV